MSKKSNVSEVFFLIFFLENCEEKSVQSSLLNIIKIIMYGFFGQEICSATQSAVTISELMIFNHHTKISNCHNALCATRNITNFICLSTLVYNFKDDQTTSKLLINYIILKYLCQQIGYVKF